MTKYENVDRRASMCSNKSNSGQVVSERGLQPDYLVVLFITTGGKQGEEMGCDESPITLLTARLVDLRNPEKEYPEFQELVCPFEECPAISSTSTDQVMDINDKKAEQKSKVKRRTTNFHLSQDFITVNQVTEESLLQAPSLDDVLCKLDKWIQQHGLSLFLNINQSTDSKEHMNKQKIATNYEDSSEPETQTSCDKNNSFVLLTDGPIGLRLVLHMEMDMKSIKATKYPYFFHYIDLRKVFREFYEFDYIPMNLYEMLKHLQIPCNNLDFDSMNLFNFDNSVVNIKQRKTDCGKMSTQHVHRFDCSFNQMDYTTSETNNDLDEIDTRINTDQESESFHNYSNMENPDVAPGSYASNYCRAIVDLIVKMTKDGVIWNKIEEIHREYRPAIIRKSDIVEDYVVAHARGLPWQATDNEIFRFFKGLNITNGGISLVLSNVGRRNGEAYIRFTDFEQRNLALRKHKHHIGERYIEVYAATGLDFLSVAAGENSDAEKFLSQVTTSQQSLIRMRGLPYTATAEEIITFFKNTNCSVQFEQNGVLFVNRCDGRATGDAFVIFETQEIAQKALENNRKHIGDRYIELFRATPAEVNQVMNSVMNPLNNLPNLYINVPDDLTSAAGTINTLLQGRMDYGFRTLPQPLPSHSLMSDGFSNQPYGNQTPAYPLINMTNFSPTLPTLPSANSLYMQPVLPGFRQVQVPTIDSLLFNTELLNLCMGLSSTAPVLITNQVLPDMKLSVNNPSLSRVIPRLPTLMNTHESPVLTEVGAAAAENLIRNQQQQLNHSAANTVDMSISQQADQIARCFIRIRGMPLNVDVTDIVQFLQEHWLNVTIYGIHQVYGEMGQPTGEAIIQFVTEAAAKSVCERKHQTLFSKNTGSVIVTVPVEVTQCVLDDLKQIIAPNLNMNCKTEPNLLRQSNNILDLPNLQLPNLTPNHNNAKNVTNHTSNAMVNFHEYGISDSNPTTTIPMVYAQQLSLFNVPPPTLQNANYFPNTTTTQQTLLPNKPVLQFGPHGIGNVVCIPPNNVGTIGHLIPKTAVEVEQLCNSNNFIYSPLATMINRDESMISMAPTMYAPTNDKLILNDWNHNQWTDSVVNPTNMQTYLIPKVEANQNDVNTEVGMRNQHEPEIKDLSDKGAIVRVQGLPKDVSLNEIAGLLNEVRSNLKLFTIQLEYTCDGTPNGNASLLFKNLDEAKQIISQYGDKKLRGHQVHMSLVSTNST